MFPDLFNQGAYAFQLRFQRGIVGNFFAPGEEHDAILRERRRWLASMPHLCMAAIPGAEDLFDEFAEEVGIQPAGEIHSTRNAEELCSRLGMELEPDFLLLRSDPNGAIRLLGGCVCFPSGWDLREKIGRPIEEIHGVVPGLNVAIGRQIQTFLARIRPGTSWERTNWGLSRSPERNQHPIRDLPRLDRDVRMDEVWLRVEHQSLSALPRSGGVLFGIRIHAYPLREIRKVNTMREGLVRSLETMPEEVATYKNIAAARNRILELLAD